MFLKNKKRFFGPYIYTLFILVISALAFTSYSQALAKIGVGIGTGKIVVEEDLKPGVIYDLPSLTILNTGDEASEYILNVTHHEDQQELRPPAEWFSFRPSRFYLEPADAQEVQVKMSVPVKARPGEYFAYLEGMPLKTAGEEGSTSIGIAAAAKLYFTITPASVLAGFYYRALTFWEGNQPWLSIVTVTIIVGLIVWKLKNKINISVSLSNKPKKEWKKEKDGITELK